MIDFCLFPVSQVRVLHYPGVANRLDAYAGARALAHRRHDEQPTSELIEFAKIKAALAWTA